MQKYFIFISNNYFFKIINYIKNSFYKFPGSENYWNNRYLSHKTSGQGSYGGSKEFKSKVINSFIEQNNIEFVDEFGCGDGNQLSSFNISNYRGYDISEAVIELNKNKFKLDTGKEFFNLKDYSKKNSKLQLALSLDVIYHLVEDNIFLEHMKILFSGYEYVLIFSSNYDDKFYTKGHVRNRKFSSWVEFHATSYKLIEVVKNYSRLHNAHFFIYRKTK